MKLNLIFYFIFFASSTLANEFAIVESFNELVGQSREDIAAEYGGLTNSSRAAHEPGEYIEYETISIEGDEVYLSFNENTLSSIKFESKNFGTSSGARLGDTFCRILTLYPSATFSYLFDNGGELSLQVEHLTFEFKVKGLPLSKYILSGPPSKSSQELCGMPLRTIILGAAKD